MEKIKGMTTCKICGRDFPLITEKHYIAKDSDSVGLAVLVSVSKNNYDAFDCPHCGCQNVMQSRKLVYLGGEDREINTQTEHDGCCGCKYQDRAEDEDPCVRCKHRYIDKWEAEDDE